MNIIAVDDELAALDDLMQAIKQAAPDAQLAGYTESMDALRYAQGRQVDVAFLDMRMAKLDGLSLAEELKRLNPQINVIAVTGYSEYALPAHHIHVSGFLEKPVSVESVEFELSVLRNKPKDTGPPRVHIQCFGSFGVFVHGKPLLFTREKTKELLAFLVYKQGAAVSIAEIVAVLWENKPNSPAVQSNARNVIARLGNALREAGIEDIILKARNSIAIVANKVSCDYYDYLANKEQFARTFHGEFLTDYSWAEPTLWAPIKDVFRYFSLSAPRTTG